MKTRFNTYDIICSVAELQGLIGMRVGQVYDIDHKTYLIKLQRSEEKCVLLLESGNRFHKTAFEWPKNVAPSGFSMKMRKHLKNKRLEVLKQVGLDRIVDLQFGTGEAAYHVFLELYDRGNIVLADHQLTILNILRQHSALEKIRFAVRETYPIGIARERNTPTVEEITEILKNSKNGEQLKKILNPHLVYGPAVIDHVLLKAGFQPNCKLGQNFNVEVDIPKLIEAINDAEKMIDEVASQPPKGYIIQKKESRPKANGESEDFYTNQEFHPFLFEQYKSQPFKEFDNFNTAVDEFFSSLESQKIDMKAIHQEKEALKKLETVKKDHSERLSQLEKTQELDKQRAELITRNQALVDEAILVIRSAVASQVSWPDINDLVKSATAKGDPVASIIKQLKLDINHITLLLSDPFAEYDDSSEDEGDEDSEGRLKPMLIDIDLDLGAYANAKRYYDQKRLAAKKQQKTIESQGKALKSAERKTKQTLKEVQTITNISKARKIFWFEKFFWFISSENYLVIGGRDQQQNELVVKRYLRSTDIYVHADIHGASSIIILNPSGNEVPPKTLNEAGVMAVCYSAAWEAKVVTSAWWVHADQVSKTAPTGEYLTTGAFMIRGKKNYLPPCHLIMGFGFLFKLEESSIPRHKDERKVREIEDDAKAIEVETENYIEEEIELSDDENQDNKDEDDKTAAVKLENIEEENQKGEEEEEVEEKPQLDENKEPDDEPHFPDTEIKIEHRTEELAYITSTTGTLSLSRNTSESEGGQLSTNKINIRPGGNKKDKMGNQKSSNKKNQKNKSQNNKNSGDGNDGFDDDDNNDVNEDNQNETSKKQQQLKRGQRGKLKKIKEKYKDQDEEERKLIMEILQSAGSNKESKKNKKGSNKDQHDDKRNKKKGGMPNQYQKSQPPRPSSENQPDQVGNIDFDDSEPNQNVNVDVIDSLTGIPITEDELLFAVPVIAPYNTLQSYKYKIKMIPGTSKRGKAARAAVSVFIRDNAASSHEKDLLKSVKEQELFQNLPGKVKLVAPNLHKLKK